MSDGSSTLLVATLSGLRQVTVVRRGFGFVPVDRNVLMSPRHDELVSFLLQQGANPNTGDRTGYTPLHGAAEYGNAALVTKLVTRGADPNARLTKDPAGLSGYTGATPFILAALGGHAGVMRTLAANGADPLLKTANNTTPLMVAAGLLIRGGEDEAVRENDALEAVKAAVDLGGDVNAVNDFLRTAMHGAADVGRKSVVQFLADKGASVDPKDKNGDTPFTFTMRAGQRTTADLLVQLGADGTATLKCNAVIDGRNCR
jgi:Notch-like protein